MKLTLWTYEGPPHVGAMNATAMKDLHFVLHAPQGDTYADLLFTMIERLPKRPPVTYSTFQARDLGKDTATLFKNAVQELTPGSSRVQFLWGILYSRVDSGRPRWLGPGLKPSCSSNSR